MKRIFISSTSVDLGTYRTVVRDAVMSLGMHPVMMEYFPAMDENAVQACKQKVLDSDILIGIYAHRYGYMPQGYTKSITEMEYDWAIAAKIPCQIFVVKPEFEWPKEFIDPDEAPLNAFKKRVGAEKVWSVFTTPDSLIAKITESLSHDLGSLSRERRQQRNLAMGSVGIIAILLVFIIAAVLIGSSISGQERANREATNSALGALYSTATATQWTPTPSPTPPPLAHVANKLSVIVAGFGYENADKHLVNCQTATNPDDVADCKDTDSLNDVVTDSIRSLPGIGQVANRNTPGVGYIRDLDAQQRAALAKKLAETLNADVIIYGLVGSTNNAYYDALIPEFYVKGQYAQQDGDFVDTAQFGTAIEFLKDSPDPKPGDALQTRLAVLQPFLTGLLAYINGSFVSSATAFESAIAATGQDSADDPLRALLYVWAGNAIVHEGVTSVQAAQSTLLLAKSAVNSKLIQKSLDSAQQTLAKAVTDYDAALTLQPDYARALIGRATALYQWLVWQQTRARFTGVKLPLYSAALISTNASQCTEIVPDANTPAATLALLTIGCYQQAVTSPNPSPSADIDVKTEFGLGEVYVWMALHSYSNTCEVKLSVPFWEKARGHLQTVTALYKASSSERQARIADLTGAAWGWLGLEQVVINGSNRAAVVDAQADYNMAVALLGNDINRQANQPIITAYQNQLTPIAKWLAIRNPPTPSPILTCLPF